MKHRNVFVPIQAVRIQNFRAVRDLTLELDAKVTVLFGVNAAGKTTILDALAIGLGAIVKPVPRATGREFAGSGDIRVPRKDRPDIGERNGVERPYSRVEIRCANGLTWDVSRYRSMQDKATAPNAIGTGSLHGVLDPLVREALDSGNGDASPTPIPLVAAYGTERAVVAVPLRERDFQKKFARWGGIDQSLRANTRFKTVFEWFRLMEDEERRERERRKDFDFKLPQLEWVRRAVMLSQLRCRNPRIEINPIRMLVDFEHADGQIEPLDITSLSDGYRTHFSLVVDVARRMVQLNPSSDLNDAHRGTNSEGIVLIDEIDLHLDPTWQASVVQGLLAAFPNTQFVLTTHSEQVIGSVEASAVRKLIAGDGKVLVEAVPFAQGASGERILIELMGAKERVPGPVSDQLSQYVSLVDMGKGETAEARTLREELDYAIAGDRRLHQADLEIQKLQLLARLRVAKQ
jgi:predicted ATP-binding protein involved in virulence